MLGFQFVGFTPREVFKSKANAMLEEIYQILPEGANSSARVVMIDAKFFFQIMIVSKTECFIAKEVLDPAKEITASRDWQVIGVERLMQALYYQINEWREVKAA